MKKNQLTLLTSFTLFCLSLFPVLVFSQLPDNWTSLNTGTVQTLREVASFNADTIFVINDSGTIFGTFDGGKTWKDRNPQTGKVNQFNALRINNKLQSIIAVGNDNAAFHTTNMGESWVQLSLPGVADAPYNIKGITNDGDNYDASMVYAVGDNGLVLKSTDDGISWAKLIVPVAINKGLRNVTFLNPDTGFVANNDGIMRTFDGGKNWKIISTGNNTNAIRAKAKFKAGKALADVVKSIGNSGGGIQTSADYGETWMTDEFDSPCDLLNTGGTVFDPAQCEELHTQGITRKIDGSTAQWFMLAGHTFQGILHPLSEGVSLDGVKMVMRTKENHRVLAETVTDNNGRFDFDIPLSLSGVIEIIIVLEDEYEWGPEFCPAPLPSDPTTMEPIEECDDSAIEMFIIGPNPLDLHGLTVSGDTWIAVGQGGVVLTHTDPEDVDGDGYGDRWSRQTSRTSEDLLAVSIGKTDLTTGRQWGIAVGANGKVIKTVYPDFTIISPNFNDSLCAGSEITINWSGGNPLWNVEISLIDVNAWAVVAIVAANTPNDGMETWTIPSNMPPGNYEIYIQEANVLTWKYGNDFTIKHCPAPPECLEECTNNLVQNWNFNQGAVFGPLPWGAVSNWSNFTGSPDVSAIHCSTSDTVSIGMWGNQANGESIWQTLVNPLMPGNVYSISFSGKWTPVYNRPYPVQFEFRAYNATLNSYEVIGISNPLTTPGNWVTMSLSDWTLPASASEPLTLLTVSATNHSSFFHPDSTSHGYITAICITEVSTTGISDIQSNTTGFELGQSYPNPFKQSTVIQYTVPRAELVVLKVYDILGNEISTLVNEVSAPGVYRVEWNAKGLPAGVYLYKMQAGSFVETKRTLLSD